MKELSIEEKAKAYDEVLKKARMFYKDEHVDNEVNSLLEVLFPELKESEDERIRKELVSLFQDGIDGVNHRYNGSDCRRWLAWLEKQGEHANFRNKIQIGDKVTRNEDGVLVNLSQLNRVAKKQTEQKLYVNDNAKEMFIKALERVEEQNNKGYKLTDCDKNSWWEDFKAYTSCTIEQKPAAWSDEDEKILSDIIKDLVHPWNEYIPDRIEDEIKWLKNRLKSLKERYTWKPSDEQVKAVKEAACYSSVFSEKTIDNLISLSKQLKTLREE